jgi:hypothetical protein
LPPARMPRPLVKQVTYGLWEWGKRQGETAQGAQAHDGRGFCRDRG